MREGFRYVHAPSVQITDEEQLKRISALAIPPAWADVWISPNPRRGRAKAGCRGS